MGMQRGRGFGSVLGSIFRNVVVPTAKSVGKSLLKTGLRKASNVMRGVAEGQNVGEALAEEFVPKEDVEPPVWSQSSRKLPPRHQPSKSQPSRSLTSRHRVQKRRRPQSMQSRKVARRAVDIFD